MLPTIPARPDTALADAAERMLVESSPLALVNHCLRTYAFGAVLLDQHGRGYDAEALFVAAALHDLGLTDTWDDGVTPFEARGAQVAYESLLAAGARPELAGLVRDAISLHLELTSQDDPRAEVAGLAVGTALDVLGLRLDDVPRHLIDEVLQRHPRHELKTYLIGAIRAQVDRKPTSRIAVHVERLHFTDLIAAAPFDS